MKAQERIADLRKNRFWVSDFRRQKEVGQEELNHFLEMKPCLDWVASNIEQGRGHRHTLLFLQGSNIQTGFHILRQALTLSHKRMYPLKKNHNVMNIGSVFGLEGKGSPLKNLQEA